MKKGKVTGIGGIFFKCTDPEKTKAWYTEHMGMTTDQWGAPFEYRLSDNPEVKGFLQWSPFKEDSTHFTPSKKEWMINYRVDDIVAMVDRLKAEGVTICDKIETYDYGKFVHIMDDDGNKIELWEPVDNAFDDMYNGKTNK